MVETVTDLMRAKPELVLENALLRQQVIILQRQVKRLAWPKNTSVRFCIREQTNLEQINPSTSEVPFTPMTTMAGRIAQLLGVKAK